MIEPREVKSGNRVINLHFHFGGHDNVKHAEWVGRYIGHVNPDVICLEQAFATEKIADLIERDFDYLYSRTPYTARLSQLIRSSTPDAKLFVLERFSEVDASLLRQMQRRSEDAQDAALIEFLSGNPVLSLRRFKQFVTLHTVANAAREANLVERLSSLHGILTKRFPELQGKKRINVLVIYGGAHTSLYHHALRSGQFSSVKRDKSSRGYFISQAKLVRSVIFRKPIRDNLLHREFLATLLTPYFHESDPTLDKSICGVASHLVAQQVSEKDFKEISRALAENPSPDLVDIARELRVRGITVPGSGQELRDYLKRKRIPLALE